MMPPNRSRGLVVAALLAAASLGPSPLDAFDPYSRVRREKPRRRKKDRTANKIAAASRKRNR
jgi:hypothetical protein